MSIFFNILIHILVLFFFIYFYKNNFLNFLVKEKINQSHGVNYKELPKAGGLLIITFLLINIDFYNINISYILFIFIITFIGILGDLKKEIRYAIRLIILAVALLIFLLLNNEYLISDFQINTLQIKLFSNFYFSLFFTLFCITVYLIGINFTDGINGNVFGYSVFVMLSIFLIFNEYKIDIISLLLVPILAYFILNSVIPRFFLGDSGSYLIGFIFAISLIIINNNTSGSASLKIGLIAFYPAFEVLFSIFRKIYSKKSPFKPDNMHLHSLVFSNLNKYSLLNENINHLISTLLIFFIFHLPMLIFIKFTNNFMLLSGYYLFFCTMYLFIYILNLKILRNN